MASVKAKTSNNQQRLEWIRYWADYMKSKPNRVWSKQQADFINSVLKSANVSAESYIKIKKLVDKKSWQNYI